MNLGLVNPNDPHAVRRAFQTLQRSLGFGSTPTFIGLTLTGLTATRLMQTNASKGAASVANLASWIAGTTNRVTVADDGDGTVTLSGPQDIHTAATPTFAGLTLTGKTGVLWANAGVVTGDATLDQLGNLAANKIFNNAAFSISFNFTNPTNQPTYDGAFEIQASGAFTGDLFHVHQHTGNPGATDLCHFEAEDADVTVLRLQHDVAGANCLEVGASGAIKLRIVDDGSIFALEKAADLADVAGYGQLWVRNDAPNNLCFTDDTGVIYELSHNLTTDIDHDALTNFVADEHVAHSTMTVAIANGGTGQTTAQLAINALTAVSGATAEHVLTKDTATGNAIFKAAAGGSDVKAAVDAAATADYIGATSGAGVIRTSTGLTKTDGGDFVTLAATGLLGDGTAGRVFRISQLTVADGTNANTIKCTLANVWNGDVIAVTDNIAKNATTGDFYLDVGGTDLRILGTGITGDPLAAFCNLAYNDTGTNIFATSKYEATPAIECNARNAATGSGIDWTTIVSGGTTVRLFILYVTTA